MDFAEGDLIQIIDVEAISRGKSFWKNGDICKVLGIDNNGLLKVSTADDRDWYLVHESELHAIRKVEKTLKANKWVDDNLSSVVFGVMASVDVSGYVTPSEQPADISQEIEDFMNEVAIRGAIDVALDKRDKQLFIALTKELTT